MSGRVRSARHARLRDRRLGIAVRVLSAEHPLAHRAHCPGGPTMAMEYGVPM
jgi:hypothetical protein